MTAPSRFAEALADRYRIERELGAGGMATVYLAEDLKHRRKVAIKVLRPELSAVLGSERFLKEIELTAGLQHPNILPLFDSGSAEGLLYYVMPYVEGETLRTRLEREHQLPIPEAIRIASAVGAALDYAHRHGAVHRDIKPENILLSEDSVLVADFGIALALRDAGGARLTETGLSLGTPQYMSPEQATGDRNVDARTDIYSLGSVLYEMLAGEPPFSGPTTQAVIAKLVTERPVRLRTLRDTVSPGLDAAVEKSLAKAPADRFTTCREFSEALTSVPAGGAGAASHSGRTAAMSRRTGAVLVGAAALAIGWGATRLRSVEPSRRAGVTLGDRTQLTTSGNARMPAISPDGKQLAYVSKHCDDNGCSEAIDVQDVDGSGTRRILDSVTDIIFLNWSGDRRHLKAVASIGGRQGEWLIPTLGGAPRYFEGVDFIAGGDSLLLSQYKPRDGVFWLRVSALDGVARDSFSVRSPAKWLGGVLQIPGTPWLLVHLIGTVVGGRKDKDHVRVIDRRGSTLGELEYPWAGRFHASHDAIWVQVSSAAVARIALDPQSGKLATHSDTLFLGALGGDIRGWGTWDVTSDGTSLVLDAGTYNYDLYVVNWPDVVRSSLPASRRIFQTSSVIWSVLSPDGDNVAILRDEARGSGTARLSILPAAGGAETPLLSGISEAMRGGVFAGAVWCDSATVAVATREGGHARLERVSIRTGARLDGLTLPDSSLDAFDCLPPDGWTWITSDLDAVLWQRASDTAPQRVNPPAGSEVVYWVRASPDGKQLAFFGLNQKLDSSSLAIASLPDRGVTTWATVGGGSAHWLADQSLLLDGVEPNRFTYYRLTGPGKAQRLGEMRRSIVAFDVSRDLKRASIATREYRGDIWMSRVVKH